MLCSSTQVLLFLCSCINKLRTNGLLVTGAKNGSPTLGEEGIRGSCFTCAASLLFGRLLKHIRWNIATFPDSVSAERCHRGSDTKGKFLGNSTESLRNYYCYPTVSHLRCPQNCPECQHPESIIKIKMICC